MLDCSRRILSSQSQLPAWEVAIARRQLRPLPTESAAMQFSLSDLHFGGGENLVLASHKADGAAIAESSFVLGKQRQSLVSVGRCERGRHLLVSMPPQFHHAIVRIWRPIPSFGKSLERGRGNDVALNITQRPRDVTE